MKAVLSVILFLIIGFSTFLMVQITLPHLSLKPNVDFLLSKQLIYHIDVWRWSFYIHVFSSSFVLFFGITQFNRWIIHRHKRVHRTFGGLYLIILLFIAAPSGLVMSFYANGGWVSKLGFVLLSLSWIFTTLKALIEVKRKNYEKHGNWMLRSYALTFAAITLRFYGYLFDYFQLQMHPVMVYTLLAYISWIPNLIVAELIIRTGGIRRLLIS